MTASKLRDLIAAKAPRHTTLTAKRPAAPAPRPFLATQIKRDSYGKNHATQIS
jgi:hypothetical protein